MLLSFKHIDKPFLDIDTLQSFTDLNTLFFDILALKKEKRNTDLKLKDSIPYLNSSLFDKTELEKQNKEISRLDSNHLAIFKHSILKKDKDYKDTQSLPLLDYLFCFLHAYDFTTTPKDIINHTKTNYDKLINAAVLGLVFEKLNGYKEGSFYTPSFITSYMCKESLEKVVIDKFNTAKSWVCDSLESLGLKLDKLTDSKEGYKEANTIFDSIKVCDPSVGSGHFLVSMLNSMIELKFRLKILCEISTDELGRRDYKRLKDIDLRLENDEILIQDSNNTLHTYQIPAHDKLESHKIQKAIFHNKRILIESCLFGVDINPNSCEITKLRLWIELLKHSFYIFDSNGKNTNTLETLPNIDINIKCGNSLISRFDLQDSLKHIPNIKHQIAKYQKLVFDYKNADQNILNISKQEIETQIESIKQAFTLELKDPKTKDELEKAIQTHIASYGISLLDNESLLYGLSYTHNIFGSPQLSKEQEDEAYISYGKIVALRKKLDSTTSGESYKNAFEWRFAFPEVLDSHGDFLGFDLVIGNPPYIRQEEIKHLKPHLQKAFRIYKGTSDIYTYFYEQGHKILKHNGILSFITSNKYCRAGYGEPLREFLLTNTKILSYTELNGIKVFDSASVDTSILSFAKIDKSKGAKLDSKHTFYYAHPKDYNAKANTPLQKHITPQSLLQSSLSKESFIFLNALEQQIKRKMEAVGTPLKEWDISINYGIKTGYNEAFIIDSAKREEILGNCATDDERARTQLLIKPILRGRDIKRYSYEWAGLWIINTHNGYISSDSSLTQSLHECGDLPAVTTDKVAPLTSLAQHTNLTQDTRIASPSHCEISERSRGNPQEKSQVKIPPIDINDYPALKHHFDTTASEGKKGKGKGFYNRADKGITPYNLRNCAYLEEFTKEKIVWNPVSGEYFFSYIKEIMYFNNSLFMMTDSSSSLRASEATKAIQKGKAQKVDSSQTQVDCHDSATAESRNDKLLYILGLMNSTLYKWLITQMTNLVEIGQYAYGAKDKIERLPIPKVDSQTEAEFIQIVQEILESKKMDCHALPKDKARNDKKPARHCEGAERQKLSINTPARNDSSTQELEAKLDSLVYTLYGLSDEEIELVESIGGGGVTIALLLIAAIDSKLSKLTKLLLENFEKELCEAFRFCEGLKLPQKVHQGKIIYPETSQGVSFMLDKTGYFLDKTAFMIQGEKIEYLQAVLNSKAMFWYLKWICSTLGANGFSMSKIFVERLPIPQEVNPALLAEIESLAAQILESKQMDCHDSTCTESRNDENTADRHADKPARSDSSTQELESRLDTLIYQLYGLEEAEITLIESSFTERERERLAIVDNLYRLLQDFLAKTRFYNTSSSGTSSRPSCYQGKIQYPCIMAQEPCFIYEEEGYYNIAPANLITGDEIAMKYLTGCLNSKFVYYTMRRYYMGGGIDGELKTNNLLRLPIPKVDSNNKPLCDEITALVEQILESKAKDSKTDTTALESAIDQLVYTLYNLSPEEIQIIESTSP